MSSSLAAQLAQSASLNSAQLVERTRRKPTESYLFSGRDANQHDLESLHALASSAFAQLKTLNPSLSVYEDALLSDASRLTDRTLLPAEARAELDGQLKEFLPRLGRHLMEVPTGRVIEWLVRRFRVHEFNAPDVLALFLPYHDSPHFTKMASILHVPNTIWSFLSGFGQANVTFRRGELVDQMRRNPDVARFAAGLLPKALQGGYAHRTLVAFHTGVLLEYVQNSKSMDSNATAIILPPIVDSIKAVGGAGKDALASEVVLSSYILLSAFSSKSHLTPQAVSALITSITSGANRVTSQQFVAALLSVLVPQDLQQSLPFVVIKKLVAVDDAPEVLVQILGYANSEKLLFPLASHLVSAQADDERCRAILKAILSAPDVPSTVVAHIAALLLEAAVDGGGSTDLGLLRDVRQRHGDALDAAARGLEDRQDEVQALLLSLAQNNGPDPTLASLDTQDTLRAAAIADIYKRLDKTGSADLPALYTALLSRVTDPSPEVLRALYSAPQKLTPIVLSDVSSYISGLIDVLPNAESEVIKLHLDFLLSYIGSGCNEERTQEIFAGVLFPLLLFSRDRRTADTTWAAISSAFESLSGSIARGILAHPLLSGCVEVLEEVRAPLFARTKKNKNKPLEKGEVASMGAVNAALASRMADNLLLLNEPSSHLSFLLMTLSSSSPHARAVASLVLRAYIGRLSGAAQITTAQRTVDALGPGLSLATLDEFVDVNAMLSDEGLGGVVNNKVKSDVAQAWLSAALLSTCAATLRPSGSISFISSPDDDMAPYAHLARSVYTALNTSRAPPTLSAHILRTLFARLGSDALALLAETWLSSADAKLQHTTLAHAYAYLLAHAPSTPEPDTDTSVVDFQTVLPALLVALTNSDKSVRQAAGHCIAALDALCKAPSASSVYAFDSIYGPKSEELQYLDWADMRKFVAGLCIDRNKFIEDGEGLRRYIASALKGDKVVKKKLDYKQKVLVFLLSHASACPSTPAKLALLRLTQPVRSALKVRTLRGLLEEIAEGEGKVDGKVVALAVDSIDASCVSDLEEDEVWGVLVKLLQVFVRDDAAKEARDVLLINLQAFAPSLKAGRRFELSRVLLKISSKSSGENELALLRPTFETLVTDARLVIRLLSTLQPPAPDTVPRAAKRAKVDASAQGVREVSEEMAELSALADVLGNAPLSGSVELLSALLETLGRVVKSDLSKSGLPRMDAVYIQQRLMSALERAASSIFSPVASSSALRVDVLVDIIRSSDAPQTSHQALLLLASLAKLAPDSVLVNVMPVFTFMGSNVLGRDDSYSFRVIQKTVDSIVPVMVEDLKTKYTGKLDLAIGARDFVRVFTDAANHIPRHRRTQFFMHLTDVLGPSDFLGLICMLFISKTANKVVRQTSDDLLATLTLPLALVGHYDSETQRAVLRAILEEAGRLVQAAVEPEGEHRVVLDTTHDDEQNSQSAALLRRRAQALLVFVGLAVERSSSLYEDDQSSTDAVNELLLSLLDMAQSSGKDDGLKEIRSAAQTAIGQALRVVPATSFIAAVGTILDVPKPRVQLEALTLLTERIGLVADDARRTASNDVGKIVGHLKGIIAQEMEGKKAKEIVPHALGSLRAMAASAVSGEENALVETVPLVINQAKERENVGEAVAALVPLCTALGPRIIPYFRDVVRECIALLRSDDLSENAHADALAVLRALFSSIPSFWSGSQLTALFALYLDVAELDGLRAFVRQIASKAQPSVLFPALFDVWSEINKDQEKNAEQCTTYFELAKRVFRAAQRPAVLEHLRVAFGVLLAGLELRGNLGDEDVDEVEEAVVGAFVELVTKLNETAFRPLFRRLFDWAFGDAGSPDRKVAFLHAYSALLDNFKALMSPYLSIVLEPLLSVLDAFVGQSEEEEEDGSLWAAALDVLAKSLAVDEGAFWRADKLAKTLPRVVAQTPVAAELGEDGEAALSTALSALCGALTDDAQVKALNLALLMHTRDEEARVRLCALRVATGLWQEHGDQLMGFTGETATFVAECAEDENDEVVRAARKLKEAAERATGEKMDV